MQVHKAGVKPSFRRVGHGSAIAHHGEILQGIFEDEEGKLRRALVTLPCRQYTSNSVFYINPFSDNVIVSPTWRTKACMAAKLTLAYSGLTDYGGHLVVHSNVPVGWGLGSSTTDVTSAIRAVADAADIVLTPATIAEIAVQAEIASDSIMFDQNVILFAHRDAKVLEDFGAPLPSFEIVSINTGTSPNGIDTLGLKLPDYDCSEIGTFRVLRALIRSAVSRQDRYLLSCVATASARINQRYLSKPLFDNLEKICEESGALGLQVAHSGTMVGLLFDPYDPDVSERIKHTRIRLNEAGCGQTWHIGNSINGIEEGERPYDSQAL